MSFFSRSRSKGHYPNDNYGSGYYKRTRGPGGILGKIFGALTGSRRHSRSYSDHHRGHSSDHGNGYYPSRHRHKSSWS